MHYYYVIAALPDLPDYGFTLPQEEFDEAVDLIERNLESKDKAVFNYLKYPNDHSNIISQIISEFHSLKLPHNGMSAYPVDLIRNFRKRKDELPDYMRTFISQHEDRFEEYSIRYLEEDLHQAYFDEIQQIPNKLLQSYTLFDHQLRSLTALINGRIFNTTAHSEIISPRLTRLLGKGGSVPAELTIEFPYLESLIEALETKHPDKIIEQMDRIRWYFIEEKIAVVPFTLDHVIGYYLKLMIIKRRSDLENPETEHSIESILDYALNQTKTV